MLPPIYGVLSMDSGVSGIVGDRIYPHGSAPQDVSKPYITWQQIAGTPDNNLSDPFDVILSLIQINCWHPVGSGVSELARDVISALESYGHIVGIPIDDRDTETGLYWIAIEIDWWFPRE